MRWQIGEPVEALLNSCFQRKNFNLSYERSFALIGAGNSILVVVVTVMSVRVFFFHWEQLASLPEIRICCRSWQWISFEPSERTSLLHNRFSRFHPCIDFLSTNRELRSRIHLIVCRKKWFVLRAKKKIFIHLQVTAIATNSHVSPA